MYYFKFQLWHVPPPAFQVEVVASFYVLLSTLWVIAHIFCSNHLFVCSVSNCEFLEDRNGVCFIVLLPEINTVPGM